MPPRLLVLGAGPGQLGLLQAARRRGLFVIAVDRNPLALGFVHADRRAILSVEDELGVERLAAAEGIDGIVAPGSDSGVAVAARVAARLGLPHPVEPPVAALTVSKVRRRERLAAAGVPQARAAAVASADEALDAAAVTGYPCVVKPADRSGQKGLALARDEQELRTALERALGVAHSGVCLVEELVPGQEVTVSAFAREGVLHPLAVAERRTGERAFGVALAHVWPAAGDVAAVLDAAAASARALGIEEGPVTVQALLAEDGPRVLEVAARLGSDHDAELAATATGVDLNDLAVSAALGDPVAPEALRPRPVAGGACVRFLVAPPGILGAVAGVAEARALERVVDVVLYRRAGDPIAPLRRAADRAGAVLVAGDSARDAAARAERAAACIRFETVDAALHV